MAHEFLAIYTAKAMEYGLAIGYLLLFIPFWRFVQGGKPAAAQARAAATARPRARPAGATALRPTAGWFHVPAGIHLHPGHTWARLDADGLVTVGMDDFAHKLVGPASVELPELGGKVAQGEPAVALADEGRSVEMLSPVDGTVLAVNAALQRGEATIDDPYGAGWLFKVKPSRLAANLRQLHGAAAARRMLEDAEAALVGRMEPAVGQVLQDGGTPVHGIARALAGDGWANFARELFLT